MGGYDRLVKEFFRKVDLSNPLHYYGYKRIVRGKEHKRRKDEANRADDA